MGIFFFQRRRPGEFSSGHQRSAEGVDDDRFDRGRLELCELLLPLLVVLITL